MPRRIMFGSSSLSSKLAKEKLSLPVRARAIATSIPPTTRSLGVNRFCSLFSPILKLILRADSEGEACGLNAERHAREVSCWQQLVSMIFCRGVVGLRIVGIGYGASDRMIAAMRQRWRANSG